MPLYFHALRYLFSLSSSRPSSHPIIRVLRATTYRDITRKYDGAVDWNDWIVCITSCTPCNLFVERIRVCSIQSPGATHRSKNGPALVFIHLQVFVGRIPWVSYSRRPRQTFTQCTLFLRVHNVSYAQITNFTTKSLRCRCSVRSVLITTIHPVVVIILLSSSSSVSRFKNTGIAVDLPTFRNAFSRRPKAVQTNGPCINIAFIGRLLVVWNVIIM